MADGHHNTTNQSEAELPNHALHGRDLGSLITPLLYATRILSLLDPKEMQGVDAVDAYTWLASYAHARAHELQSFLDGHRPQFHTDMDAAARARVFKPLPSYSERWPGQG
jgi:hypothetical protein